MTPDVQAQPPRSRQTRHRRFHQSLGWRRRRYRRLRRLRILGLSHHARLQRVPRDPERHRHQHRAPRRHEYFERDSRSPERRCAAVPAATKSSSSSPMARISKAAPSPPPRMPSKKTDCAFSPSVSAPAAGDLIPVPAAQGGGFVKDENGQFVKSHLDEAGLKAIAEATGGFYVPLRSHRAKGLKPSITTCSAAWPNTISRRAGKRFTSNATSGLLAASLATRCCSACSSATAVDAPRKSDRILRPAASTNAADLGPSRRRRLTLLSTDRHASRTGRRVEPMMRHRCPSCRPRPRSSLTAPTSPSTAPLVAAQRSDLGCVNSAPRVLANPSRPITPAPPPIAPVSFPQAAQDVSAIHHPLAIE